MFSIIPGIAKYATVTELRSITSELIDNAGEGVLIQKNNKPLAVLMSFDRFIELSGADVETDTDTDNAPTKGNKKGSNSDGDNA